MSNGQVRVTAVASIGSAIITLVSLSLLLVIATIYQPLLQVHADFVYTGGDGAWAEPSNWLDARAPATSLDTDATWINSSVSIILPASTVGARNLHVSHASLVFPTSSILALGDDLILSDDATLRGSSSALLTLDGGTLRIMSGNVTTSGISWRATTATASILPVIISDNGATFTMQGNTLDTLATFTIGSGSNMVVGGVSSQPVTVTAPTFWNGTGTLYITNAGLTRTSMLASVNFTGASTVLSGSLSLPSDGVTGVTRIQRLTASGSTQSAQFVIDSSSSSSTGIVPTIAGAAMNIPSPTYFILPTNNTLQTTASTRVGGTGTITLDGTWTHTFSTLNLTASYIYSHGGTLQSTSSDATVNLGTGAIPASSTPSITLFASSLLASGTTGVTGQYMTGVWWSLRGTVYVSPPSNSLTPVTGTVSRLGINLQTYASSAWTFQTKTITEIASQGLRIQPGLYNSGATSYPITAVSPTINVYGTVYTAPNATIVMRGLYFVMDNGGTLNMINGGNMLIAGFSWNIVDGFMSYGSSLYAYVYIRGGSNMIGDGTGTIQLGEGSTSSTTMYVYLYNRITISGVTVAAALGVSLNRQDAGITVLAASDTQPNTRLTGITITSGGSTYISAATWYLYSVDVTTTATTSVTIACPVIMYRAYYSDTPSWLTFRGAASTLIISGTSGKLTLYAALNYYASGGVTFPPANATTDGTTVNNGSLLVTNGGVVAFSLDSTSGGIINWSGGNLIVQQGGRVSIELGATLQIGSYASNVTTFSGGTGGGTIYVRWGGSSSFTSPSVLRILRNCTLNARTATLIVQGEVHFQDLTNVTIGNLTLQTSYSYYYGIRQLPLMRFTADPIVGFYPVVVDQCFIQGGLRILLNGFTATTPQLLLQCNRLITGINRFATVTILGGSGGVTYTTDINGVASYWYDPSSSDEGDGTGLPVDPNHEAREILNRTGYSLLGIAIAGVLAAGVCAAVPTIKKRRAAAAEARAEEARLQAIRAADGAPRDDHKVNIKNSSSATADGIRVHGTHDDINDGIRVRSESQLEDIPLEGIIPVAPAMVVTSKDDSSIGMSTTGRAPTIAAAPGGDDEHEGRARPRSISR